MKIISHRCNLSGSTQEDFNNYVEKIITNPDWKWLHLEIDAWYMPANKTWKLGHDEPKYDVNEEFLKANRTRLYIHAKNTSALLRGRELGFNVFWHEEDKFTVTSYGEIWCHSKNHVPIPGTIYLHFNLENQPSIEEIVKLEYFNELLGICTDNPIMWRNIIIKKYYGKENNILYSEQEQSSILSRSDTLDKTE